MKILYIVGDPGICLETCSGAAAHILETVRALRKIGHEVLVVATHCNDNFNLDISGIRIKKLHIFEYLISKLEKIRSFNFGKSEKKYKQKVTNKKRNTKNFNNTNKNNVLKSFYLYLFYNVFRNSLNYIEDYFLYPKVFSKKVEEYIKNFSPDFVYERYSLGHFYVLDICKRYNIPHVLEVNALLAKEAFLQKKLPFLLTYLAKMQERNFFRKAELIFVVSKCLKDEIDPYSSKIIVNPNGVDIDHFNPQKIGDYIKKQFNITSPVVGWVGTFKPMRGLIEFLEIAKEVLKFRTDITFLLVGDGPLKPYVVQFIKENSLYKNFILPGRISRSELPYYIAVMDIALAPYPSEGAKYFSPLKVLEYMAMQKAVIATSEGQCIDLLSDGAGILLPISNFQIWAKKIIELLNNKKLYHSLGKGAREKVEKYYTWENNALTIIKNVEKLIKNKQ